MPRLKRRSLARFACVLCSVMPIGAAACSGAVDLGSHSAPDGSKGEGGPADEASTDGSTVSPGAACGSRGLPACASPQVCIFALSAQCGESDKGGTCRTVPAAGTCPSTVAPVCGCDGQSYSNECLANSAATSVRSAGDCP